MAFFADRGVEGTDFARALQWRHGDEIGLGFPDFALSAAAPELGDLALRVAKLESTVAALRRKLQQLKSNFPGADDTETA